MALSEDGKTLYVSHNSGYRCNEGRISLFDTDLIGTGTDPYVRSIETGDHRIMALAANGDGSKLYGAGTLYSDPQNYDKVTVIDTATDDVSQPIDLVGTGIGASPDGDTIYVGTVGGDLVAIDTEDNSTDTIAHVGNYAFSPTISDDGRKALIYNGAGIQVVDLETGSVTGIAGTQTAPIATFVPGGSSVYALAQDLSNPSNPVSYIVHITGNAANDAPEDITVDASWCCRTGRGTPRTRPVAPIPTATTSPTPQDRHRRHGRRSRRRTVCLHPRRQVHRWKLHGLRQRWSWRHHRAIGLLHRPGTARGTRAHGCRRSPSWRSHPEPGQDSRLPVQP